MENKIPFDEGGYEVDRRLKRTRTVLPIGTVMELTDLTARQIRYYEEFDLVSPQRSQTNRRLYSLRDVDRLLEIADLIESGKNMKEIQNYYQTEAALRTNDPSGYTDQEVRRLLMKNLRKESPYQIERGNPW